MFSRRYATSGARSRRRALRSHGIERDEVQIRLTCFYCNDDGERPPHLSTPVPVVK